MFPVYRGQGLHGCVADIEIRGVNVSGIGQEADRRFDRVHIAVATGNDPLQNAQVLAKARPQKLTFGILAEPVDVEYLRQVFEVFAKREPMCPVVSKVVAAERLHRHWVAADDANFTNVRRRSL